MTITREDAETLLRNASREDPSVHAGLHMLAAGVDPATVLGEVLRALVGERRRLTRSLTEVTTLAPQPVVFVAEGGAPPLAGDSLAAQAVRRFAREHYRRLDDVLREAAYGWPPDAEVWAVSSLNGSESRVSGPHRSMAEARAVGDTWPQRRYELHGPVTAGRLREAGSVLVDDVCGEKL